MKRYTIHPGFLFTRNAPALLVESEDGELINYKDHVEIVKYLMEERPCVPVPVLESIPCNCEEMVEKYKYYDGDDATWFCPAHGYKKL